MYNIRWSITSLPEKGGIILPGSIAGLLLAALLGFAVAYTNYRLTGRAATNPGERFAGVSLIRQALNLGYLAAVYFLGPYTPWDRIWLLVGAVAGLTLPTFFFTFRLLRRLNNQRGNENDREGGES